eukprot:g3756.t1
MLPSKRSCSHVLLLVACMLCCCTGPQNSRLVGTVPMVNAAERALSEDGPLRQLEIEYPFSCTGKKRVCSDDEDAQCAENVLEKQTVHLRASASWESVYIVWIAEVLLREVLQQPVHIVHDVDAFHNFYNTSKTDSLNTRPQLYTSLAEANENMTKKSLPHAILDDFESDPSKLQAVAGEIEEGGSLGLRVSQGWFVNADVADEKPEIASWRGLKNPNTTSSTFPRMLTFGEHCMRKQDFHACLIFFAAEPSVDMEICSSRPLAKEKGNPAYRICALFFVTKFDIEALSPRMASLMCGANITYGLCEERFLYNGSHSSPSDASSHTILQTWSPSAKQPLYGDGLGENGTDNGPFATVNRSNPVGYISHVGCWSGGPPGFGKFEHDLPRMLMLGETTRIIEEDLASINSTNVTNASSVANASNASLIEVDRLWLTPLDYGDGLFEAMEVQSRLRAAGQTNTGTLVYLWRPHHWFQRNQYKTLALPNRPWLEDDVRAQSLYIGGYSWKLSEVGLPMQTSACLERRRNASRNARDRCDMLYNSTSDDDRNWTRAFADYFGTTEDEDYSSKEEKVTSVGSDDAVCSYDHTFLHKYFAEELRYVAPEAHYLLKNMRITVDDIESIMGRIEYSSELRAISSGTHERRRRAVCQWVAEHKGDWEKWIPVSAKRIRCLGEVGGHLVTESGQYRKGLSCSGHGICKEYDDSPSAFAGVCVCERGYSGKDCSTLDFGFVLNLNASNGRIQLVSSQLSIALLSTAGIGGISLLMAVTPIFFHAGRVHSLAVSGSAAIIISDFGFWVGPPSTTLICTLRPGLLALGIVLGLGAANSKLIYVLGVVESFKDVHEDVCVVRDRPVLISLLKVVTLAATLMLALYITEPRLKYVRVPGRIWEMYQMCDYGIQGTIVVAVMAFVVVSQSVAFFILSRASFLLARKNGRDHLYLRESTFLYLSAITQLLVLVTAAVFMLVFPEYQSPNEEKKITLIGICIAAIALPQVAFMFLPKLVAQIFCRHLNDMRNKYTRKARPVEILEAKKKNLEDKLWNADRSFEQLRIVRKEDTIKYSRKMSIIRFKIMLLKAALSREIPTLHRFLKCLQLSQYETTLFESRFTVAKLIEMRGDFDQEGNGVTTKIFKPSHLRKIHRSLHALSRMLDYNDLYIRKAGKFNDVHYEKYYKKGLLLADGGDDTEDTI